MKIILNKEPNPQAIINRRVQEDLALSPSERLQKAFRLMRLSLLFKKGPIKEPQKKGIVLQF
jgi:hypothetical protein